jgi:hypothetical protein
MKAKISPVSFGKREAIFLRCSAHVAPSVGATIEWSALTAAGDVLSAGIHGMTADEFDAWANDDRAVFDSVALAENFEILELVAVPVAVPASPTLVDELVEG